MTATKRARSSARQEPTRDKTEATILSLVAEVARLRDAVAQLHRAKADAIGRKVSECAKLSAEKHALTMTLGEARRQAVAFLGEIATALGIDAKADPWWVIEYARRLRAAAAEEVRAARAFGAAVNDGTHEEEIAASRASANALAVLEEVLRVPKAREALRHGRDRDFCPPHAKALKGLFEDGAQVAPEGKSDTHDRGSVQDHPRAPARPSRRDHQGREPQAR